MTWKWKRVAPWVHAALVGVVSALAYVETLGKQLGAGWGIVAVIAASRILGAFVSAGPKLPKRQDSLVQVLTDLRIAVRRLVGSTHGLSNHVAVLVGEIDLLVERLNAQQEED